MRENLAISYTYEWLYTTFGNVNLSEEEKQEKKKLIRNLLIEEYIEYIEAIDFNDRINALADLKVVAMNLPFYLNLTIDDVMELYYTRSKHMQDDKVNNFIKIMSNIISLELDKDYDLLTSIIDIIYLSDEIAYIISNNTYYNIELEDKATFMSNMTKFDLTLEDAEESVRLYKLGQHPNKMNEIIDAKYEETGHSEWKYRIVRNDGKILKSLNFKDVEYFK